LVSPVLAQIPVPGLVLLTTQLSPATLQVLSSLQGCPSTPNALQHRDVPDGQLNCMPSTQVNPVEHVSAGLVSQTWSTLPGGGLHKPLGLVVLQAAGDGLTHTSVPQILESLQGLRQLA